jgi:nucleotide-binding universal stress UspA family protein
LRPRHLHHCVRAAVALCVGAGLLSSTLANAQGATPALQTEKSEPGRIFRVLIAVLPFEVHSAESLGELETNLAEVLRARLEASGRVDVLDAVVLREALVEHVAGESSEALLQRRATELGADWIVEGSLSTRRTARRSSSAASTISRTGCWRSWSANAISGW